MKINRILSLLVFCLSMGLATMAQADFFDDSWGDLREDLNLAKEAGQKGLFLFYEMDECPFCSRMKAQIFTQKEVQDHMKPRFRALSIDIEGDTELTDFAGNTSSSKVFAQTNNRVRATPVMIFYDLEGNSLYRHTGPLRDSQEFLWLAQYIDQGLYSSQRFNQYLREQRKANSN
jgi:thioredoxin-related protein